MDFQLTEEQKLIRDTVRDFAQQEIAPRAQEMDEQGEFPWEIIHAMAGLGFLGLPVPEKYGGAGADTVSFVLLMEEIARASGSVALTIDAHTGLCCEPLLLFGTEEQKQRYLVPLARGEKIGGLAVTEPGGGSDIAGGVKTAARRDGGEWVISGGKAFITNGSVADVVIVLARTDPAKGKRGFSHLMVEKGTPGFRAGKDEKKMGLRASVTTPLFFEECRVPADRLLGVEGEGLKQSLIILDNGRVAIAAMAVGLAQAAFEAAVRYARERTAFGGPLADLQAIQWKLADMATEIEAARLMVYHAAWLKDQGRPFKKEAAMAKLFASEMAERACFEAIQIHGGYGYIKEYGVERMYRDQRLCTIGEGTSEIQRWVIAREVLGRF
jgi:alkylation response protein AidB-like acyl-CoA dehydrogenase